MKTTIKIQKKLVTAPIDFGEVMTSHSSCGVDLVYEEYGFMQFSSDKLVLFDAYSAAHKYGAFNASFGVIAFPFCLCCMTDEGERVAYCGLRFGEEKAVQWRLVFDERDESVLAKLRFDRDAASTVVSSGVCVFSDVEAYAEYRKHINDEIHPLSGQIVLNGQTHCVAELFGKKYAVFSSGWGDGKYRCYVGLTEDGRATALIADFGMIAYEDDGADEYVDVEIETADLYVYDPQKTDTENNISRWTHIIQNSADYSERIHAYSRRGYAYHSAGNLDAALSDYEAAAGEFKKITDRQELLHAWSVYDNAAAIYESRSDYDSAIRLMREALQIHDKFFVGAYIRLIDLYMLTKATDKAMDIAKQMVENRPDDPVAQLKYAEVCVASMEYARAATVYERLATEFMLYEHYFDQASCLIELGDYESADIALESHPAGEFSEQYWYYKAYIDVKNNRLFEAIAKARKSHEIDPEYMPALYLLIETEALVQEYHAVAAYAEEYKRLRPDNEYGYSICADAQLNLGNFSECSRNYFTLYDRIKRGDEKYGALAAITAAKMGDVKRKSSILKNLKKKRSPYYYGAMFAIYIKRYGSRDVSLTRVISRLRGDDDFLLGLSTYLSETGNILPAAKLLKVLIKEKNPPADVVARQIVIADMLGDEKLFTYFFDYYISHFIGENISQSEREVLMRRFRRNDGKNPIAEARGVLPSEQK